MELIFEKIYSAYSNTENTHIDRENDERPKRKKNFMKKAVEYFPLKIGRDET